MNGLIEFKKAIKPCWIIDQTLFDRFRVRVDSDRNPRYEAKVQGYRVQSMHEGGQVVR